MEVKSSQKYFPPKWMLLLLLLEASPGSSNLSKGQEQCGVSKYDNSRIANGREAKGGSWPWMAMIYKERRGLKEHICGGALVTHQHVVTGAHCVTGRRDTPLNPRDFSVRLGEHDIDSTDDDMGLINVNVSAVTAHENFNTRTFSNDIAVLKLVRPVEFNTNISPICLPYDALRNEDLSGRIAFVAGWGSLSFGDAISPVLLETSLKIQNQTFCRYAYKDYFDIADVYLCAATFDGSQDLCMGHGGSPLMILESNSNRFYMVGIVSFGKGCGDPEFPGVYTKVTKYLDWLRPLLRS